LIQELIRRIGGLEQILTPPLFPKAVNPFLVLLENLLSKVSSGVFSASGGDGTGNGFF
jgi:hypothetical protein